MEHVLPFLAGSLAGVVTKTLTAPLERVKTILQVEGMSHRRAALKAAETEAGAQAALARPAASSILQTFRAIHAADGLVGFWFGNTANCLRVVPVYALKFGFNDNIKDLVRTTPDEKLSYLQLVASGTLAGLFQMTITYPLETVRTRLTVGAAHGAHYDGIWHCLTETVKYEGVSGLYKGLTPTMLTGSPYVGLQMSSFEMLTRWTRDMNLFGGNLVIESVCCGALSGMVAQTITYPGDTIRKRMQTDGIRGTEKMYRGMWDCARQVAQSEGIGAFFAGLKANVIRGIPGAAIQFTAYNFFKRLLVESH